MEHALTVEVPGAEPVRRILSAPATAGGSRADGLLLPGAPPAALRLVPLDPGVVVEPRAAGVRVAGHAVRAGERRLLRPGERVELPGVALRLASRPHAEGTRALASPVLRGDSAGDGPALVVLTGPRAGARYPLRGALSAGRGRAASVRVPDPLASRVHLRVSAVPGGATVEDLRSKNGVRVNGVAVDRSPRPVRPGDEIVLGDTVLCVEDAWDAAAPDPAAGGPRTARGPGPALGAAALLAVAAAALALAARAAS